MPRFENEGFNPKGKNRDIDRTVPQEENYYGNFSVDLDFNSREKGNVVRDNQKKVNNKDGFNPCNSSFDNIAPPVRSQKQQFSSETPNDFRPTQKSRRSSATDDWQEYNSEKRNIKNTPNANFGKGREHSKNKTKLIMTIIVVLIIALIICGFATVSSILGKINYTEKQENTYISAGELESDKDIKNILLLGVDARKGESANKTRSDTMMLVSLDKKTNSIKLTSFLRDTWVYVPALGYKQRLNAACSSGGYQGVVDAIEYNFGVDIDGYAVVDFNMFEVLVDSLGGVEVDVTEAEANEVTNHKKRYGNVKLDSGKYKLTGEQALAYCRIRKIDTDFVRTERQRTVMSAILKSAKHSNPLKLLNMASKSAPYIETDLTKSELEKLAITGISCLSGDIVQTKVPFTNTWEYANIYGNSVIAINVEKNKEKLKNYIYVQTPEEIKEEQKDK